MFVVIKFEMERKFDRQADKSIYSELIAYWASEDVYGKINAREKKFRLHDGPAYSNGDTHLGHAVNRVLKDAVNRIMAMSGYGIEYIRGWDCNGLPIESKVEAEFKTKGISRKDVPLEEFIKACKDCAEHWIKVQKESFIELGTCADNDYYTTIQPENQLAIVEVIHEFAKRHLFYQHLKPIAWSCEEETALAEAEVEYHMKESKSIYCLLKIHTTDISILQNNSYIPIWTTTPWSLPSNKAIAYNKDFQYFVIQWNDKYMPIAKELLDDFIKKTNIQEYKVIGEITGDQLKNTVYIYPFTPNQNIIYCPMIESSHVMIDQGTGFVHISPDHGIDDDLLGHRYNLGYCNYIKENGCFIGMPEYLSFLENQFYSKSEDIIINKLGAMILNVIKIQHSYAHSWRSRKPLIYRATSQWFIDLNNKSIPIKKLGIKEAEKVKWMPGFCNDRFISTLSSRESWCCSRQRVWGTPIALFHKNGEILLDHDILHKTIEYMRKNGIYSWYDTNAKHDILGDKHADYQPIKDIIDIWFESGATQYFMLQKQGKHPADMYLEGSDQNKAWFQSSMLLSVALTGKAPYKKVLTHGYVVDSQGRKMSKSLGNGKSPREILDQFGPDVLRLWVLQQNYTDDIKWSNGQMIDCQKIEHKIRNTIKFLINNSKTNQIKIEYSDLSVLEKWILHKIHEIHEIIISIPNNWKIHTIVHRIYSLCEVELSKLYFDIRKDALYWETDDSMLKIHTQYILDIMFNYIVKWIAPIMPFTAEDAWLAYCKKNNIQINSIHLQNFANCNSSWENQDVVALMKEILSIRDLVNVKIEELRVNRKVKSSMDCNIVIYTKESIYMQLANHIEVIKAVLSVSNFNLSIRDQDEDIESKYDIEIYIADGEKCIKCKKIFIEEDYIAEKSMCNRCDKKFD